MKKNKDGYIIELDKNECLVFGSNILGRHDGGAARLAFEKFGAYYHKGVGIQRQSYAIPTLGADFEKLPLAVICLYLYDFKDYAESHPELKFLLTKVGCGIASFSEEEMNSIMPVFPSNVIRV